MTRPTHLALDLFAGAGGWDVAAHDLGAAAWGVEIMAEARATRVKNGLLTHEIGDVWRLNELPDWEYDTLLASPPCQAYSTAGDGAGRKALTEVLEVLHSDAVHDIEALREATTKFSDERIGLVLTPMTYVHEHWPMYLAFEQVPPVLPVWEAMAAVLETYGYKTWTGVLNAEQYGVPQTRRRAVLIARADGVQPKMPTPTHSRFYPRDPSKLDAGVPRWVSMADALLEGATERPAPTVTGGGTDTGGAEPFGNGARQGLRRSRDEGDWLFAGAGATAQQTSRQRPREQDEPAHTITSSRTATLVLRSNYGTSGDPANRGEREIDEPAPTVTSKVNRNLWQFNDQSGTPYDPDWPEKRPATVVAGREIVQNPGASANRYNGATKSRNDGIRITVGQAAALQSFPEGFDFEGKSGKQYLQIGNAVPPLLAEAVLRELWGE